jgi:predicted heme/steroid binding protein
MKKIVIGIIAFIVVCAGSFLYFNSRSNVPTVNANTSNLTVYTLDELKQYDGTDPQKPIYIAMNGYIYDVSAGRSFYETGGSYHYLAGKDSSQELNLIGGDIIKRKYPVVGILK